MKKPKKAKLVLKRATKPQLRALIRRLKKSVLVAQRLAVAERVAGVQAVLTERSLRHRELAAIRTRANTARDIIVEEANAGANLNKVANLGRAVPEWIAYGPAGESPMRNGVHPFVRWGLETPEAREQRLEEEARKHDPDLEWERDAYGAE